MEAGLKNRVAIIAAASQGIGLAAAHALAAEGSHVAICARNRERLETAAAAVRDKHGVEVLAKAVDVTDGEAVHGLVAAVAKRFGRIDICVTNAGGPPAGDFLSHSAQAWRKAFELNFMSTVYFAREVIPYMQQRRWGRLIAITSVSVRQPLADLVLSNAVRSGIVGLMKSLANEYGKDGILVNNVAPGWTATERLAELAQLKAVARGVAAEEVVSGWSEEVPLGRLGRPEEIADVIAWLASERASYVTGQTILVDGGFSRGL